MSKYLLVTVLIFISLLLFSCDKRNKDSLDKKYVYDNESFFKNTNINIYGIYNGLFIFESNKNEWDIVNDDIPANITFLSDITTTGQRIIYCDKRDRINFINYIDLSKPQKIETLTIIERHPLALSISKDANFLAFSSHIDDNSNQVGLFTLNLENSKIRRIASDESILWIDWSDDNKHLYFANDNEIIEINLSSLDKRVIISHKGQIKILNDNSLVYYEYQNGGTVFKKYSLELLEESVLLSIDYEPFSVAWSDDGNFILVGTLSSLGFWKHGIQPYLYDIQNKKTYILADFPTVTRAFFIK